MTYSITARCSKTGMLGVAVTSSSMAVAARCAFVRAGVGAVASQNITDPRLGPRALDLMAEGASAPEALARMLRENDNSDYRQLALVDAQGGGAHHSGSGTLGRHAVASGEGAIAAGNLLAQANLPSAMIEAFLGNPDEALAERLIRALEAGLSAGSEVGSVRSAGVLVADREAWPLVDLRVDWSEENPISGLRALWHGWAPQMHDYVTRALDPARAPTFAVPGDP